MTSLATVPIDDEWTHSAPLGAEHANATVAEVTALLASIDPVAIDPVLGTLLAEAAAEVAVAAGIAWRADGDDPPVALVRLLATVARRRPTAGGPHTARVHHRLLGRGTHAEDGDGAA